jgi:hypothetical protein
MLLGSLLKDKKRVGEYEMSNFVDEIFLNKFCFV